MELEQVEPHLPLHLDLHTRAVCLQCTVLVSVVEEGENAALVPAWTGGQVLRPAAAGAGGGKGRLRREE